MMRLPQARDSLGMALETHREGIELGQVVLSFRFLLISSYPQ